MISTATFYIVSKGFSFPLPEMGREPEIVEGRIRKLLSLIEERSSSIRKFSRKNEVLFLLFKEDREIKKRVKRLISALKRKGISVREWYTSVENTSLVGKVVIVL